MSEDKPSGEWPRLCYVVALIALLYGLLADGSAQAAGLTVAICAGLLGQALAGSRIRR